MAAYGPGSWGVGYNGVFILCAMASLTAMLVYLYMYLMLRRTYSGTRGRFMTQKNYDAIVIGAGHNGLTNAAFLAKAGLDVLVLEKNDYTGGATVSPRAARRMEILQLLLRVQPVPP